MRLLIDQDVWAVTVTALQAAGHDVVRVSDVGMARATDAEILTQAASERRTLITRDLGFGLLLQGTSAKDLVVVTVRAQPSLIEAAHTQLLAALEHIESRKPGRCIVIVEPSRFRLRRLPP